MKFTRFCHSIILFTSVVCVSLVQAGGSSVEQNPEPKETKHIEESTSTLKSLLNKLNTLDTNFQQIVFSVEGEELQQASGQLQAMRPGKVRWSTLPPMEQLVVSDSETLWIYDPDLEQVTIRSFDQDLSKTPAALFIGNLDALEQTYKIYQEEIKGESTPTEQSVTLSQFILIPRNKENLYTKIVLGFTGNTPVSMSLWDTLEQKTHIVFVDLQLNQPIAPEAFYFTPPEGTDIICDE